MSLSYMKLSELLRDFDYEVICGDTQINLSDVVFDSRKAGKENVFVCITGAVTDGHQYIESAVKQGCQAIVVERELSAETIKTLKTYAVDDHTGNNKEVLTIVRVEDTKKALARMSALLFSEPAKKLLTIAITGTKGKTTTTFMIRDILEQHGIKTGIIGTTGVYIGETFIKIANTTPASYDIHRFFHMMVEEGCKACVMEVSSQALKLDRTYGILFDYGIFTNLAPDHIGQNEHADYAEYVHCKSLLFSQCRHGLFNMDDKEAVSMQKNATCDIHTYGLNEKAQLYADHITYLNEKGRLGIAFELHGMLNLSMEVNTPGKFSVYNALAAIQVSELIGVTEENVREALLHTFVKGRVEQVKISDDFILMIDYAHNAMSMRSILETMREYRPKRLVSLFGCGGNRSKLRRYEMGETSGQLADLTIITADNSRDEDVMDIIEDIKTGIHKTNGAYEVIPDRKEAIRFAIDHAESGDIILLLGKGHEDYQEIKGVKYPFDERVIIQEIIKGGHYDTDH